jgi:excisionase family DNA binding protein
MSGDRLLTSRELADYLGFSPATVVDWAEARKIPSFKIGGRLRFRLTEVEAWLETHRGGRGVSRTDQTSARPFPPHSRVSEVSLSDG